MFERFFSRKDSPKLIGKDYLDSIYWRLLPYEKSYRAIGLKIEYRRLASPELVSQIFRLSKDIGTTAHLIRVLQERQFAEGMLEKVNTAAVIAESGPEVAQQLAIEQYHSAKIFCDEIISLAEMGKISGAPAVGKFLDENLTVILASWARYKIRFIT